MRIAIAALLLSVLAMPLVGAAGPVVRPAEITLRAGESAVLHGYQNAGGFSEGFPYRYDFVSDAPAVASVRGFASGSSTTHPDPVPGNGDVFVMANQPGIAHVRAKGYSFDLATITVLRQIAPVEIHTDATRVSAGKRVVLIAVVPGYDQPAVFYWYRGHVGDISNPLQASTDPRLSFVAPSSGVSYFWVQALAGSVSSSAEIAIESVAPPRRHSAKH
jgi:hypothetical protein